MSAPSLEKSLQIVRRRLWAIGICAGLAWALATAILLLLIGSWLDLLWELSPLGRIGILGVSAAASLAFFGFWLLHVGREGRYALIARRIDRSMEYGGDVLTGWELEEAVVASRPPASKHGELTIDMAWMAVAHALKLAESASPARAVPARPAKRSALMLMSLLAVVVLAAAVMPGLARTQWNRFTSPFGDVPPFSKTTFVIDPPADKKVNYGDPLDLRVAVEGEPVDAAELVLEDESGRVETLPMFPEPDSHWRASLAKVTSPAKYYVRSFRARSEKHAIEVITVPQIENVRFRIIPPAYTNLPAYEGPMPKEGVSGLPGAKIQIWATSNRPLSHGNISVTTKSTISSLPTGEGTAANHTMKPTSAGSSEVMGEFTVAGDGKFELQLFDEDERPSRQRFSGSITLLADQRPMIRIVQPPATSLATPQAVLPVVISAEDDYGVSRVELYRNLNDSRPLPAEVPLPSRPPRRFAEKVELPLADYMLQPGDIIKLFARVEDNDPVAAKGDESSVVTVEIISQEEFERMALMQNGLELMLSRYREAERRLEATAEAVEQLRKKLESQKPGDKASEETKRELKELAKRMKEEAAALKKLADHKLPYEMDQKLSSEMSKAAQLPEEAAEALEKMLQDSDLHNEAVERQLKKMGKQLAGERKAFDQSAMQPMEYLAAIMPLMADQERFKMLVLHQKDLAERLAALKGRDREDNPALRARMRELEDEQREVREALNRLLDDIEENVKKLPGDQKFDKLRKTASEFAENVRESGAAGSMSEAESGLDEFSGTIGYAKAKEASDTLEKFLSKCNGMGDQACDCDPAFRPGMGNCMRNTIPSLLPGMGSGSGSGIGSGSGNSSQNGFGQNIGLYGGFPGMEQLLAPTGSGQSRTAADQGKEAGLGGSNPNQDQNYDTSVEGTIGGAGRGAIPLQYRRQIGQYFERITEEVKEK